MILDKQGVIDYIIQSPNFANEVFNLDNCKFRGDCFINLYVNDPETYKRRCIDAGAVQRDGGLAFPDGKQPYRHHETVRRLQEILPTALSEKEKPAFAHNHIHPKSAHKGRQRMHRDSVCSLEQ